MEDNKKKKYRGFNKSNLLNWLIVLEKYGYVKCSFKNCSFMAFDIEEMAEHYSLCDSDKSYIKYFCEYCCGGTDSESKMLKHKVLHHPQFAEYKDFSRLYDKESELFPRSNPGKQPSYVLQRSWQVFLENRNYIKCLVQTCQYVADTLEQMTAHFNYYCTPYYREQLVHTCLSCQGRTDSEADLKKHQELAHQSSAPETNLVSPAIVKRWSDLLVRYHWAKCFNPDCNFIDCDINTLKAHYKMCTDPSKVGYVECSKCRGWLNGFTRLRYHIKMMHNPYNPQPMHYMNQSSEDNALMPDNIGFSENNSTDSAMPHKSKVISIFDVGSPTSTSLTDRVECNSEDGSMGNRPVSNGTSAEVENVNLDLNQGTDDHLLSPSRIQIGDMDDLESGSDDKSLPDLDEKRLSCDSTKVYSRMKSPTKKLPPFFPPSVPKTTRNIDCEDTPRYQVTFPRDMLETNEWKLEMPFVTMKSRNTSSRKNKHDEASNEVAIRQCGGPVTIRIDRADSSWTVQLPPSAFNCNFLHDLKKGTVPNKQLGDVLTDFKKFFWDKIETDMLNLLNLSVRNSSLRNRLVYHGHMTRNDECPKILESNEVLFEPDPVEAERELDDPEAEFGINQDRDSDCDNLFEYDLKTAPEIGKNNDDKDQTNSRGWCVKFVNREETESRMDNSISDVCIDDSVRHEESVAEESGNGCSDNSVHNEGNLVEETCEECTDNSFANDGNMTEESGVSILEKSIDKNITDSTCVSEASDVCSSVPSRPTLLEPSRASDKDDLLIDHNLSKKSINVGSLDSQQSKLAIILCDKHSLKVQRPCNSPTVLNLSRNKTSSKCLNWVNEYSVSKEQSDSNDSWNDLIIDLRTENQKKMDSVNKNLDEPTNSEKYIADKCDGSLSDDNSKCLDLSMKKSKEKVAVTEAQSKVCSDGIHCGTDDEGEESLQNQGSPPTNHEEDLDRPVKLISQSKSEIASQMDVKNNSSIINNEQQKEVNATTNLRTAPEPQISISLNTSYKKSLDLSCNPKIPKNRKKLKRKTDTNCPEDISIIDPKKSCLSNENPTASIENEADPLRQNSVARRKCSRPRRKKEASPKLIVASPSPGGSGNEWPIRTSARSRPATYVETDSYDEDIIIPDCDVTAIEGSDLVPTNVHLVNSEESQESFITCKTRRPKTKRSTDLMASLGDRITPNSPLTNGKKKVTCALCLTTMTAEVYQSTHLLKHNFLCWLMDEMPLPLDDFNTMVLVANRGKRAHPAHVFKCEKCQRLNKSASGYLCHIRFCGKSKDEAEELMEACHLCSRLLKPNCIDQHMRIAHSSKSTSASDALAGTPNQRRPSQFKKKTPESSGILAGEESPTYTPEKEDSLVPATKRVIPRKLMKLWKDEMNKGAPLICPIDKCSFSCECYDTIQSHYRSCNPSEPSQTFSCKQCPYSSDSRNSFVSHMKNEHCITVHLAENSAYYPIHFLKELEDDIFCSFTWIRSTTVFKPCLKLTKQLRDKYYSNEGLYPDLRVVWEDWESMEDDNPSYQPDYLTSPAVRYNSTCEWLRLPCYSAATFKGESLVWTGGCIRAMAWCPTPPETISEQYLAVACQLNFSSGCPIGSTCQLPTCIQLWDYGVIYNGDAVDNGAEMKMPKLAYGLCTDEGPIWDLEWCPSGSYDRSRLGLLACASAAGCVNIYALPHSSQLLIPSDRCPLFKGVASLKLLFSRNESFQCQAVSWSKVKPHKIVAGGFVNGFVALWDLSVSSTFLREGSVLYPCRLFQAHHSSITCVKMCPVDNNYLVTGSLDKFIKVWDSRNVNHPVHCTVRGCITDLDWLTHWIAFGFGMDAGCTPTPSSAMLTSVRDFSFQPVSLLNLPNSSVMSISANDWLNCFASGYDDGSVILTSCLRQFGDGSDAKKKISKLMVRSTLIDLAAEKEGGNQKQSGTVLEDSSSFEDTINVFGISITTSKTFDDKGKMESGEDSRNDVYPIHSVNKVCFNINRQSFLTVAIGFNSGFVSVLRLTPPRQLVGDIQQISGPSSDSEPP